MMYDRLFLTFALHRTGQHACLNWVCRQLQDEGVTHFNNCGLLSRGAALRRLRRSAVIEPLNGRFLVYTGEGLMDSSPLLKRSLVPSFRYLYEITLARTHRRTRHAVFSFEGTDLSHQEALKDIMRRLPSHKRLTVVIIVRDPFNWVASCLQRRYPLGALSKNVCLWKQHARECLGETNLLGLPIVDVNFNRWTQEATYRAELASRLAIPYSERGVDEVSTIGGGSSFDHTAFEGRASQMPILNRWLRHRDNPHFLSVAECPEIRELSQRYFGFGFPGLPYEGKDDRDRVRFRQGGVTGAPVAPYTRDSNAS